jgi:hypothetical protein
LYLKQYLTPTMILGLISSHTPHSEQPAAQTYHRFVKTTPKPRATKNSNGDCPPPVGAGVFVGAGVVVAVGVSRVAVCRSTRALPAIFKA